MADSDTLLAHLVLDVRITRQVEVAATRSLVYILNKSTNAMAGLVDLIENSIGVKLAPARRAIAEFAYRVRDEEGRIDFVVYDNDYEKRIVGEAKFGEELSRGQGSGYLCQLSKNDNAVLLFVVPDYRLDYLWAKVSGDLKNGNGKIALEGEDGQDGLRVASVTGVEHDWHFMMVSWRCLLANLDSAITGAHSDAGIKSDISQLRGLAELMDHEAIKPLQKDELQNFARRWGNLTQLINDVVEANGGTGKLLTTEGMNRTGSEDGYVRYFKLNASGTNAWLGFSYKYWRKDESAIIWFGLQSFRSNKDLGEKTYRALRRELTIRHEGFEDGTVPIRINEETDLAKVKQQIIAKVEEIANTINDVKART